MKKLLLISLFAVIVTGGCGTMDARENINKTIEHMSEKYGEEFKPNSMIGEGPDQPYSETFLVSESHPGNTITVYNQDGKYKDNYYGILIKDEYVLKYVETFSKYVSETRIYVRMIHDYFPENFDKSLGFEEALLKYPEFFNANVFVFIKDNEAFSDEIGEKIVAELVSSNLSGIISVHSVPTSDYEELSEDTYREFLQLHYDVKEIYNSRIVR